MFLPFHFIPNASETGRGNHPGNIVFLTADAFGILPPISKLTPEQAIYHSISGYTAKVTGTEHGVNKPQTTFSACFGAPFTPLRPTVYAELLAEKIKTHILTRIIHQEILSGARRREKSGGRVLGVL